MSSIVVNKVVNKVPVLTEQSVRVSGVDRPVSHSSEVKRTRKAAKNKSARQRKQARKRECTEQATTTTTAAAVAASGEDGAGADAAAEVQDRRRERRQEDGGEHVALSDTPGLHQQAETAGAPMISAADVIYAGAGSNAMTQATHQPAARAAVDMAAVEVEDPAEAEVRVGLQQQPQSQPPLPPKFVPQSQRSIFIEEGTPEFEEWTRNQTRLTAWARETDAELKRANGNEPNRSCRRYAPPSERYSLPIFNRTAAFAVQCGFGPGIAPQLLSHVVRTVYGQAFASSVVALPAQDVERMFRIFWDEQVAPLTETERLFRLAVGFGDDGMTKDTLRPLIAGSVQCHPEFIGLSMENQGRYVEIVLETTFSRLGRYGVITLEDLRRSDFAASLNAVARHEIGLEESVFFSRFTSLTSLTSPTMFGNWRYQQPSPSAYQQPSSPSYGQGGPGWGMGFGGGLPPYNSGDPNVFWATSPSTVATGSRQ